MPLYEYQCSRCGAVFEIIQKFSDSPLEVHENCGGAVSRLISASALQFKGSGWYVNDYARGSSKGESKDGKSDSKPAETKPAETKTESKPAAPSAPAKGE